MRYIVWSFVVMRVVCVCVLLCTSLRWTEQNSGLGLQQTSVGAEGYFAQSLKKRLCVSHRDASWLRLLRLYSLFYNSITT